MLYLSWHGRKEVENYMKHYPDYKLIHMMGEKPKDGERVVLLYKDASHGVSECINCTYKDNDGYGYFLRGDGIRMCDCIAWRPCPEEWLQEVW